MNEFNKCNKFTSNAMAEGNVDNAEHFLKKPIRINPNDDVRKQLEQI